jgi:RimJ/RimL family protein N-acetyltransferase
LRRWRAHWDEHGYGLWAVEERAGGRFVGRIGLSHHRLLPQDVEVGWALDPAVWGRGYATEGGAAALAHAFGELGVGRVVSIVHPENAASIAVMERLGIRPWRTVWWPEGGIDLDVRAIKSEEWRA